MNNTQTQVSSPRTITNINTEAALRQEIARLKAQNEALAAKANAQANRPITLKVSEKGALSAYGLGRFPVTLYREQWEKLLAQKDSIETFIATHDGELKVKGMDVIAA